MADAIDGLYGLPLDEFIGARDALAKELRAAGDRDGAAAVKALKKPSVAAWAVNQALRTQGKAARELWQAGDALAAAQEAILGGKGSGADLRAATERERAAVEPLVDAARGLLTASGGDLSETTIERVRQTLHAGAIDPDAREEIASGRATRERAPQGLFGGGEAVPAPPAPKREGKAAAPSRRKGAARESEGATPRARKAAARGEREDGAARKREDAAARKREDAAARKREDAAARKREEAARQREAAARERKEAAARERARKAAEQRVAKAEKAFAAAEKRSAEAAERLDAARGEERVAADALAEARAELHAAERG
jgi:hypothetical protein